MARLDAQAVQHDASAFYRAVGSFPVMLTNALPDDSTVRAMTLDSLAAHLAGGHIEAYSHVTSERENVPAEIFFQALRYGPCHHNVVDHPVDKTPLHNHIRVPGCFQSNWLPPNCNEFGISPLSLTVSPAGNFTPMHVDGYGMQGWMLLLHGCKHWRFIAPEHARLRMDPSSAELPSDEPSAWEGVPRFETIARRGDLVFIPPGWAHQVLTIEPSVRCRRFRDQREPVRRDHDFVAGRASARLLGRTRCRGARRRCARRAIGPRSSRAGGGGDRLVLSLAERERARGDGVVLR